LSKNETVNRNIGADVIRCIACFFVVSVHFFLHSGFYTNVFLGKKMFVMTLFRSLFITCVPLFMILSGYLMKDKKLNLQYYKKIWKTVVTYVLASVACILYRSLFLKEIWGISKIIRSVLDFTAAPYSWYVEMYLGLFLLVPFLNILYNNIPSKQGKKALILVLFINTAMPAILNVYNFHTAGWWSTPSIERSYNKLIPAFFVDLYPVTYYFIGCYLREYGIKIKKALNLLLILGTTLILGAYTFWRSNNSTFVWGDWDIYHSPLVALLAVLLFTLFINLEYKRFPLWVKSVFKKISALSFGIYLVSWIFDNSVYPQLLAKVPEVTDRFPYYVVIVPFVFICSFLLSWAIELVEKGLTFILNRIKPITKKSQKVKKTSVLPTESLVK